MMFSISAMDSHGKLLFSGLIRQHPLALPLGELRLSKKSSFCWAFSIFYDIIHMGDENA